MANVFKGKLDIKNVKPNFNPIFVQYDHARLEIEMLDNRRSYDLTNVTRVEFTHVLSDETVITHPGEIVTNGNKKIIRYEYQGSEMDLIGYVDASFAIFDANNKKVSSHSFTVEIKKDLRDEHFNPAQPNYGLLQTLIDDVEDLKLNGGGSGGGQGPQGDPGYTPIKGVDYFDGRDGRDGIDGKDGKDGKDGRDGYTPIKGVDYFDGVNGIDGKDGKDGIDGSPGRDGIDGSPGRDGIDGEKGDPFTYEDFTPTQLESLRGPQGPQGDPGESGLTREEVLDEISNLSTDDIKAPEYNPDEGIEVVETLIPFTLVNGFVQSNSGGFDPNGTNWRTLGVAITNNGENTYKVKVNVNGSIPQIRVLMATSNDAFLGSFISLVNDEFTVPSSTAKFSLNFTLPNPVPDSNLTPFPNIETLNAAQLVKITRTQGESSSEATLSDALTSIEKRLSVSTRALRVLMLGNSFSEDVSQYIHNIASSADVDLIFGNLYRPGESLDGHWIQINTAANSYTYHLRSSIKGVIDHTQSNNMSFFDVLKSQDWDIITYQQASPLSGMYNTFDPYLGDIIDYVNENKTNPKLRHALHMTWAYPTNSTESGFANYDNNQQTMYNAIVDAYQQAMFEHDIDLIIPVGTAIQNARTISYLQTLHNDLASDGSHLGASGDFIGGLTIFESLIAAKYKKDIFEDVKISLPNAKYHAYLSKIAVKNAVLNPFTITNFGPPTYGGKFEWRANPTTNSLDLVVLE